MKKNRLISQLVWLSFIALMLTAAAAMLLPLIRERAERRQDVQTQMARAYGEDIVLMPPVAFAGRQQVMLQGLSVSIEATTTLRHRGIFKFPQIAANLKFDGKLIAPATRLVIIAKSHLTWTEALLAGREIRFTQSVANGAYIYEAKITGMRPGRLQLKAHAMGIQTIAFVPNANTVAVDLVSNWRDPGFFGANLPAHYQLSEHGFQAHWQVTDVAQSAAAMPAIPEEQAELLKTESARTGVNFYQPVDIYQLTERSVKYAFLFIALTFLSLFLFETVSSAEIHPMQYFLAGLALVIFYLLLLALAEFIRFLPAYVIASAATITLLTRYSASFLITRGHILAFASVLAVLYSLLFVILQLEELALLAGSLTLFAALAATMYLTRRTDWYGLGRKA